MSQATLSSNQSNSLVSDSDLVWAFGKAEIARRQYEVVFALEHIAYIKQVWADNKVEANRLAREYAARIMNQKFRYIQVLS